MYKGYVFNKLTGEALSGVRVSDGRNTVLTDDGGAFCLEGWERAAVISVNVLTTSHDDWYKPIKNAGGDFNFYITPAQTKAEHSFIHITDSEVGEKGCANWIDFLIGSIKKDQLLPVI